VTKGLPIHWRLLEQRYNLVGTQCKTCKTKFFPPRVLCPTCRRKGRIEEFRFSGEGEVFAHTTVHVPPAGFEFQKPYVLGIIKLREGPLLTAQIVDCRPEDARVGRQVRMVFRRIVSDKKDGVIKYSYKFRLC